MNNAVTIGSTIKLTREQRRQKEKLQPYTQVKHAWQEFKKKIDITKIKGQFNYTLLLSAEMICQHMKF